MGQATEGVLEIQVHRAVTDTWEPKYVAAYYHKNPWKQARWEYDSFGHVTDETGVRLRNQLKKQAPKVIGVGLLAVGTLAYLVNKAK